MIAPRLPAGTSIVAIAAPTPVMTAQPTSAATAAGTSAGIGIRLRAATTACSAKHESREYAAMAPSLPSIGVGPVVSRPSAIAASDA
jgi:hypothetical protein